VLHIMITMPNGERVKAALNTALCGMARKLPKDEFLYRYLLLNTAMKAYDEGLPDEEQKVLKYFGIKYWEPGTEEVEFEGKIYKVDGVVSGGL
jgi:hypothetical protein